MSTEFKPNYDISNGNVRMILHNNGTGKNSTTVAVQLITDATFDGTNTKAKLLQSNDADLDINLWNELPEQQLNLPSGEGSALLQSVSFNCKFLAIEILAGNATTGIIKTIV